MFGRFRRAEEVIGFALSGGGARSASQVGVLRALVEGGIWPQRLAGTSAGAVNAAWFALHPHRLDALEEIWLSLRMRDVFPGTRLRMLANMARRGYVHDARAWEAFLRRRIGTATFEDAAIPFGVTAVRISDGRRVVFESGEIVPALLATTAIPGIFPPYRIDDEYYVDGGVLEYLPIPTLLERAVTTIYAIDCSHFATAADFRGSVLDRCACIGAAESVRWITSLPATRGRTIHVLRPELPDLSDARDFRRTAEIVLSGYDSGRKYLEQRAFGGPSEVPTDSAG